MMKLWASSSAIDTDFTAKLIDVHPANDDYPEGYAMNLSDGAIRARYRKSFEKPEFMSPGKIYEFGVRFHPTGNLFTRGHQIRLAITSSNFPAYDINPNTGFLADFNGKTIEAENTVYHARAPSVAHSPPYHTQVGPARLSLQPYTERPLSERQDLLGVLDQNLPYCVVGDSLYLQHGHDVTQDVAVAKTTRT